LNDQHRQWLSRAHELRRQLAEKPTDVDLLAAAEALAREGRQLGLAVRPSRDIDLGWTRRS